MRAIFELVELARSEMADNMLLKRREVEKAYHGEKWQAKVRKMSDQQVIAVYLRLKSQGKV